MGKLKAFGKVSYILADNLKILGSTGCASKNGTHKACNKFKLLLSNNSIYDDLF
jgi:hypothetical protein